MSNLGRYQDIVTDAKRLGGVEDYLRLIEARAVTRATPRLVARSVGGTLVVVASIAGFALEIRRRMAARHELVVAADAVRSQMVDIVPTGRSTDRARPSGFADQPSRGICPAGCEQTLQPYTRTALKCSRCGALVSRELRPRSPNRDVVCAWCGRPGHGKRACDVPPDAEMVRGVRFSRTLRSRLPGEQPPHPVDGRWR